ncbi:hypothetical protein ACFXTH_034973 [Malus domestica]
MMITEALGIHDITEALGIEDCKNESPKLAEGRDGLSSPLNFEGCLTKTEEEDAQNSPRWELKLGIHGGHKSLASMMITEALGIHDITEALGIEDCKNESPKLAEGRDGLSSPLNFEGCLTKTV